MIDLFLELAEHAALLTVGIVAFNASRAWVDRRGRWIAGLVQRAAVRRAAAVQHHARLRDRAGFRIDMRNGLAALATVFAGPTRRRWSPAPWGSPTGWRSAAPGSSPRPTGWPLAVGLGWALRRWFAAARHGRGRPATWPLSAWCCGSCWCRRCSWCSTPAGRWPLVRDVACPSA